MRTVKQGICAVAVLFLLAVGAPFAFAAAEPFALAGSGRRVMPLGDSITDGVTVPGGYRIGLWRRLVDAGRRPDFVGSKSNGPGELGDRDHEGHSGWRIDQIDVRAGEWLASARPDVVLLHIGTNDMIQNFDVAGAPQRLATLIEHITAAAPQAQVYVATIIRMTEPGRQARAAAYNAEVPKVVAAAGARVHLVDMAGALTDADLVDGVHPNEGGYDKMAAVWFAAISAVPSEPAGSPVR